MWWWELRERPGTPKTAAVAVVVVASREGGLAVVTLRQRRWLRPPQRRLRDCEGLSKTWLMMMTRGRPRRRSLLRVDDFNSRVVKEIIL